MIKWRRIFSVDVGHTSKHYSEKIIEWFKQIVGFSMNDLNQQVGSWNSKTLSSKPLFLFSEPGGLPLKLFFFDELKV